MSFNKRFSPCHCLRYISKTGRYEDDDYFHVFDEIFIPVGKIFEPDIILVCCGFDALKGDPMG